MPSGSQGADQKRQAFSKRKRGIVLKAYQLYKLCDAKVCDTKLPVRDAKARLAYSKYMDITSPATVD